MRRRQVRTFGCVAILSAALFSCATGLVDVEALASRNPALASLSGQHLDETSPYVWPHAGSLVLLLCRWPTGSAIPVAFPPNATPEEAAALEAALRAWDGAGLGVRLQRVAPGAEQITIQFDDDSVETAIGEGVGGSIVDCRLSTAGATGDPLPAEIRGAIVRIARRTPKDFRHKDKLLTPDHIAGIALHELGHALGFQGHVSHGDTAMVRSRDDILERGRALMRGEHLTDATLRALYAVPSGAVLKRIDVPAVRTEWVDRLSSEAERRAWRGPYLRVGDRDGRVFWRDAAGEEYGITITDVNLLRKGPERLVLLPETRARALLEARTP